MRERDEGESGREKSSWTPYTKAGSVPKRWKRNGLKMTHMLQLIGPLSHHFHGYRDSHRLTGPAGIFISDFLIRFLQKHKQKALVRREQSVPEVKHIINQCRETHTQTSTK